MWVTATALHFNEPVQSRRLIPEIQLDPPSTLLMRVLRLLWRTLIPHVYSSVYLRMNSG
eukprot:Skav233201  [mRNA]  locus=scaffold24:459478:459654:+ [translate_table: standard]